MGSSMTDQRIPWQVLIQGEYWGPGEHASNEFVGEVLALFLDGHGEMWCAFETADQLGVQVISVGSRFFRGFTAGR